jgi:hypothetical protein
VEIDDDEVLNLFGLQLLLPPSPELWHRRPDREANAMHPVLAVPLEESTDKAALRSMHVYDWHVQDFFLTRIGINIVEDVDVAATEGSWWI